MSYGTHITEHALGRWGRLKFAQWDHPNEQPKSFTERDIDWLAQFIKAGSTVADVGAFTGDTALPMAVAAGKRGLICAFEPNPASASVLNLNAALNSNYARILVVPSAIGIQNGSADFFYHCEEINGGLFADGMPIRVKVKRLDECSTYFSFCKFDTEGQDGELLEEFTPFLKTGHTTVQVERFPGLSPERCQQLWSAITNYGTPFLEGDWEFSALKELPSGLCNIVIKPHE